jgi:EF-P beta-lysylation protein EpmB
LGFSSDEPVKQTDPSDNGNLNFFNRCSFMPIVANMAKSVGATTPAWQMSIKTAIRSASELCRRLELPPPYQAAAEEAERSFTVFAPLNFVSKMRLGDPHDPLLRQVLPLGDELAVVPGFASDPVGDDRAQIIPGLLQKYNGRVLLITTGACAIHCRYCFRREYPYHDAEPSAARWQAAIEHIESDRSIEEVILSGGDPLMVADDRLTELVCQIASIDHVRRIRIHSRLPIVIPERVTGGLLSCLRGTRLTPIMVVHANHSRELEGEVGLALQRIVDAGIPVLNQAVLLRGVNDDSDILAELCRGLVDLRVMPYYLHQLDRVRGAAHFEVPVQRGLALIEELRTRLPGYAVPRYVQEIPGDHGKHWIRET